MIYHSILNKFGSDRIFVVDTGRLRHDIATTKKKKCKFKCSINMYCYHVCLCIIIINVCKYIPCELNRIETIFLSINGFPVPFTSSPRLIDRIYQFLYCGVVQLYRPDSSLFTYHSDLVLVLLFFYSY